MQTTAATFNPRIHRQLHQAGASKVAFTYLKKHPRVLERFYLMTVYAMKRLNNDVVLLRRLDEHFKADPRLSSELVGALEAKGLYVVDYAPKRHLFYLISGTSRKEFKAMGRLLEDMTKDPIVEDLAVLFLKRKGIELTVDGDKLSRDQVRKLKYILNPQTLALTLMQPRGIKRIVITDRDFTGVSVEKDGERVLSISRAHLGDPEWDIVFRIIESLS